MTLFLKLSLPRELVLYRLVKRREQEHLYQQIFSLFACPAGGGNFIHFFDRHYPAGTASEQTDKAFYATCRSRNPYSKFPTWQFIKFNLIPRFDAEVLKDVFSECYLPPCCNSQCGLGVVLAIHVLVYGVAM
jgi:hypothetical protein